MARSRLIGALLLVAALVVFVIGGVGLAQAFLAPNSNLHSGTIYESGYQTVVTRTGSGPFVHTRIPIVDVRLDDGTSHTVESTPLFNIFNASRGDLHVQVQLDANNAPKRIRYAGKWYGVGPPVGFWIGFGLVLLAAGALLTRAGIRRLRVRVPHAPSTARSPA